MARNQRRLSCAPEDIFAVLRDGWLYPSWVVGTSRMRDVEAAWPDPGSKLHHSFGIWPALLNDSTSVVEWDPPRRMVLTARGWPVGEARVEISVTSRAAGCDVVITEDAIRGPAARLPAPLRRMALGRRNAESLRRLAYISEGRADLASQSTQ